MMFFYSSLHDHFYFIKNTLLVLSCPVDYSVINLGLQVTAFHQKGKDFYFQNFLV